LIKKANDRFETARPDPRPLRHETEAETKTNYCETETKTETKKVVSRPCWSRELNIPENKYALLTIEVEQLLNFHQCCIKLLSQKSDKVITTLCLKKHPRRF